jgi:hypothetical protein
MFEVEIKRQVINDGTYLLDETERIDINIYSEIVYRLFLFSIERRNIEDMDRVTVNIDFTSVNYRVISV